MKKLSDNIFNEFINYLLSLGISASSIKFYKSDLSHFLGWLIFHLRTFGVSAEELKDTIPFLNHKIADEYKSYMLANPTAHKTVNRRLSALRHLSHFLIQTQIVDFDFTEKLTNLSSTEAKKVSYQDLIENFKKHLEAKKASPVTIKNYLSDIKQFFSWLEKNQSLTIN